MKTRFGRILRNHDAAVADIEASQARLHQLRRVDIHDMLDELAEEGVTTWGRVQTVERTLREHVDGAAATAKTERHMLERRLMERHQLLATEMTDIRRDLAREDGRCESQPSPFARPIYDRRWPHRPNRGSCNLPSRGRPIWRGMTAWRTTRNGCPRSIHLGMMIARRSGRPPPLPLPAHLIHLLRIPPHHTNLGLPTRIVRRRPGFGGIIAPRSRTLVDGRRSTTSIAPQMGGSPSGRKTSRHHPRMTFTMVLRGRPPMRHAHALIPSSRSVVPSRSLPARHSPSHHGLHLQMIRVSHRETQGKQASSGNSRHGNTPPLPDLPPHPCR